MRRINLLGLFLSLSTFAFCSGCNSEPKDVPPLGMGLATESVGVDVDPYIDESLVVRFAVLPQDDSNFSKIFAATCLETAEEINAQVVVQLPDEGTVEKQNSLARELLKMDVSAIAVNPIDGQAQINNLNRLCGSVETITFQHDSPESERQLHVGTDHHAVGRDLGALLKTALPEGGKAVLLADRIDGGETSMRRQGLIDELLGRDRDASFYRSSDGVWDSADQPVEGGDFTLVTAIVTEDGVSAVTEQVTKLLEGGEEIQAIIGLFDRGVPASVAALKDAKKLGEVKLLGFGQHTDSLVALRDGHCEALIVEDPIALAQEVTRTLKNVLNLQRSKLPDDGYATVPARTVTRDNFDQFVSDWRAKLSAATATKAD